MLRYVSAALAVVAIALTAHATSADAPKSPDTYAAQGCTIRAERPVSHSPRNNVVTLQAVVTYDGCRNAKIVAELTLKRSGEVVSRDSVRVRKSSGRVTPIVSNDYHNYGGRNFVTVARVTLANGETVILASRAAEFPEV